MSKYKVVVYVGKQRLIYSTLYTNWLVVALWEALVMKHYAPTQIEIG